MKLFLYREGNLDMDIIYEDRQVLVCYKPAGIPVQSAKVGAMDFVSMVKNELAAKSGSEPYLGLIHRLDQPVEGLIVFAKTKKAAASLSAQAAGDEMVKQYLAVTCGYPQDEEGMLKDYLLKESKGNSSRIAGKEEKGARLAVLSYQILEKKGDKALIKITLHSGRHHQIRVQTANAGFPLYGDMKYNSEFQTNTVRMFPALCAARLSFRHPENGKKMEFSVPPHNPVFREFSLK